MRTPLALCNNCNQLWVDNNPQVNQKQYIIEDGYPELELHNPIDDSTEGKVYCCPDCITDAYLIDYTGEIRESWTTVESIDILTYLPEA